MDADHCSLSMHFIHDALEYSNSSKNKMKKKKDQDSKKKFFNRFGTCTSHKVSCRGSVPLLSGFHASVLLNNGFPNVEALVLVLPSQDQDLVD